MSTHAIAASREVGWQLRHLTDFARQQPVGAGALAVIALLVLVAAFAGDLAPHDPYALDPTRALRPPGGDFWLGCDMYGRDLLSRLLYGTSTVLIIGFGSSFLGCSVGALIGAASAYAGGYVDLLIQRIVDIMLAIPIIITVMIVVAIMGRPNWGGLDFTLIAAIAIPIVPPVTRVIRSAALTIRVLPYIDAARAGGYSHARIVLRHMLPNIAAPYLILLTNYIAQAILLEAALAFLGLGITEPAADWGLMLSGNSSAFYRNAPWIIVFPGLAIAITVFCFNLLGDALRDWLDPKFKA
jgi:peptide/nickel transport system permease protein